MSKHGRHAFAMRRLRTAASLNADDLRALQEGAFNRYYREVEGADCVYCFQPATHKDHAYPLSKIALLDHPLDAPADLLVVVPCCIFCNGRLGTMVFSTMEERKAYARLARSPAPRFAAALLGDKS